MIRLACEADLDGVTELVRRVIEAVYPRYYPRGAVDFFIGLHQRDKVRADLELRRVYVLEADGKLVGTVTVEEDEITRLFVDPAVQRRGHGTRLLDFAEGIVFGGYPAARVHASLPAKLVYLGRGYRETSFHQMETGGDYLCYSVMEKRPG